jgi:hypothetical protein
LFAIGFINVSPFFLSSVSSLFNHINTCSYMFPPFSQAFHHFSRVFPCFSLIPSQPRPPRPWPLWRGQDFEKLAIFGDIRGRRGAELKVLSAIETKSPGGTLFQMSEICSFGYGSIPMKIP